jgi:hypothetical protein
VTDATSAPSFSAASHTVINVGEEEHPRLISCVKASQGFTWNQGTFYHLLTLLNPYLYELQVWVMMMSGVYIKLICACV